MEKNIQQHGDRWDSFFIDVQKKYLSSPGSSISKGGNGHNKRLPSVKSDLQVCLSSWCLSEGLIVCKRVDGRIC